jgi:hypothetical protein
VHDLRLGVKRSAIFGELFLQAQKGSRFLILCPGALKKNGIGRIQVTFN